MIAAAWGIIIVAIAIAWAAVHRVSCLERDIHETRKRLIEEQAYSMQILALYRACKLTAVQRERGAPPPPANPYGGRHVN